MKVCKACGEEKPLSEFYKKLNWFQPRCIPCHKARERARYASADEETIVRRREYARSWRAKNREKLVHASRDNHLRRSYGISASDYGVLLASQDGLCAICGSPPKRRPLVVDHDHDTGCVRSLLCIPCNVHLGFIVEHPDWLDKANDYLAVHS